MIDQGTNQRFEMVTKLSQEVARSCEMTGSDQRPETPRNPMSVHECVHQPWTRHLPKDP